MKDTRPRKAVDNQRGLSLVELDLIISFSAILLVVGWRGYYWVHESAPGLDLTVWKWVSFACGTVLGLAAAYAVIMMICEAVGIRPRSSYRPCHHFRWEGVTVAGVAAQGEEDCESAVALADQLMKKGIVKYRISREGLVRYRKDS